MIVVSAEPGAARGRLACGSLAIHCSLGVNGITWRKTEGDGCTPAGTWPLRRVFYRPDKSLTPQTALPLVPIDRSMGWSDDPADPISYNRLVTLPYPYSHEVLWRADDLYDVMVELGYNDAPPVPGLGSAIFLHVESPDQAPTAGCVAVPLPVLALLLAEIRLAATITISDGRGQR